MSRANAITTRMLLSIIGVIGASVMSSPSLALSHEEWVIAFVRFVEWPAAIEDNALVVCQPPETPTLELEGKQVRGLTLQVVRMTKPRDLDRCHVFVAMSNREAVWLPWLNTIKARPILAVGSASRFCELGGAICLIRDEVTSADKYQLNLDTITRAGFKVSSQLLRSQPQRTTKGE